MALRDLVEQARALKTELPQAAKEMDAFAAVTDQIVRNAETLNELGRVAIDLQGEFNTTAAKTQGTATGRLPETDRPGRAGGAHARKGDQPGGPGGVLGGEHQALADLSDAAGDAADAIGGTGDRIQSLTDQWNDIPRRQPPQGFSYIVTNPDGSDSIVFIGEGGTRSGQSQASPLGGRGGSTDVIVKEPTPGERLIVGELQKMRRQIQSSRNGGPAAARTVDFRAEGLI